MKITKKQLKRIIKEEAARLARNQSAPAPMQSRATPEIRAAVSNSEMQEKLKQSAQSPINEVEYYGDPLDDMMKEAMSILRSMNPMERNPRIYDIIDDLEDLAARG